MNFDLLSFEQTRLIFVVYTSSIIPLILIPYLHFKKIIPSWTLHIYILFFFICAIGWEVWFNYGIINGYNVNIRRAEILSSFLPGFSIIPFPFIPSIFIFKKSSNSITLT